MLDVNSALCFVVKEDNILSLGDNDDVCCADNLCLEAWRTEFPGRVVNVFSLDSKGQLVKVSGERGDDG